MTGCTNGDPPDGIRRQLHAVHRAKARDERNADIVRACTIVIFVEPGPPGAKVLRQMAADSRTIINVPALAHKKKATSAQAPTRKTRSRSAQPDRRTRKIASYAIYDAQQARNDELLRKVNPPDSLVDAWR